MEMADARLDGAFRAPAVPLGGSSAWERAGVWCWRAPHVRHVSRGLCSSSFRCILLAPNAPALRRERSALSLDMDRVIPTPCRVLAAARTSRVAAVAVYSGLGRPSGRVPIRSSTPGVEADAGSGSIESDIL